MTEPKLLTNRTSLTMSLDEFEEAKRLAAAEAPEIRDPADMARWWFARMTPEELEDHQMAGDLRRKSR